MLGRAARLAAALSGSPRDRAKLIRGLVEKVIVAEEAIIADSEGSRPRIRDDVAQHSDLISLGVPR